MTESPANEIAQDWLACSALATANPVFFLNLCRDLAGAAERNSAADILDLLARGPITGDPTRAVLAWARIFEGRPAPHVSAPRHVFPVYLSRYDLGMVVPLQVEPSDEWSVSDAFGTFAFEGAPRTPIAGLMGILGCVEAAWRIAHGESLPLRWRRAFTLSIGCPLHFRAIGGRSLELPLLLALLRELAAPRFSAAKAASFPFGDYAVFASGKIVGDGSFGEVRQLVRKLEAFVRETPGTHQAVLTSAQIRELEDSPRGRDLLGRIGVHCADSVVKLIELEPLAAGLSQLAGPPHPTEIDALVRAMDRLGRSVRFDDAAAISGWLLPHAASDHYRIQLRSHAAMMLLHRGRYLEAKPHVEAVRRLAGERSSVVSAGMRVRAMASLGSEAFDRAAPDEGLALLDRVADYLRTSSGRSTGPAVPLRDSGPAPG